MTNDSEEKQPPRPAEAEKSAGTPAAPSASPFAPGGTPSSEAPAKPVAPSAAAAAIPPKPGAPAKPPGPPPPPKEAPPKPAPLDNDLVRRYKTRFSGAIQEALLDRRQAILVIAADRLLEIARYSRDEEDFNLLVDLTAVDWPKREKRFDLVLNLYSFPKNERLRIKALVAENEPVPSVESVWPTANWLEREAFDMFGIVFEGHSNLKRLLLPEEWQGYPLRKDYDILQQDEAWVRENLGIDSGQ
ncbi:MAG: NADH-quinone oxidoreductase subunit C [Acidobacteria bacterium]|nr:MAG: NADH-quinone oxidoreductase subunit C [Acidobacteriota bacterium]